MTNTTGSQPTAQLFVSAVTQTIHTSKTCSVTKRNLAYNLDFDPTQVEGFNPDNYKGCKRCDGHDTITRLQREQLERLSANVSPIRHTAHADCAHEATKAARALCRRTRSNPWSAEAQVANA